MKKLLVYMMALCSVATADARIPDSRGNSAERDAAIEAVMADAKLPQQKGGNDVFTAAGTDVKWRNGLTNCPVIAHTNERDEVSHLGFLLEQTDNWEHSRRYYEVKMSRGVPRVTNRKGVTVEHVIIGRWDMLVFRNAKRAVIDVALRSENVDSQGEDDLRDMINGLYVGAAQANATDTVCFGAVYGADSGFLPGPGYELRYKDLENYSFFDRYLVAYVPERMKRVPIPHTTTSVDPNGVRHFYANGQEISQGEFEQYNSPGYGGHASLHGPLLWWVVPDGTDLAVELYEPFEETLDAFYSNFREPQFALKWVRSPYKGLSNRWAVLSMRPITRGMLVVFGQDELRQMLAYLNGRKAPTAIERLNKSLIEFIIHNS